MNDKPSSAEGLADELYREAAKALTEVMSAFLERQAAGSGDLGDDAAKNVATMIKIWTETGDYFIQRVRAEYPGIRDRQDIEILIEETRESSED